MGSGDLNAKKSWHPLRSANINAIHKAEAEAIRERKLEAARQEEIKEDRKREELHRAIEANGGKVRPFDPKLAWMYEGPNDSQAGDGADKEAYLLGKRRIDKLLQEPDSTKSPKVVDGQVPGPTTGVLSARDMASKLHADPMMAMKKAQQDALEAVTKDPLERRKIMARMRIDETKEDRHRRHKERRLRHHRRDYDEGRDRDRYRRRHVEKERERDRGRDRERDWERDRERGRDRPALRR
jgi:hypothetical protein